MSNSYIMIQPHPECCVLVGLWRSQRGEIKEIARERIHILLKLARSMHRTNPTLSRRYTWLARKIGMRAGVRIPRKEKRFLCRSCGVPLVPGSNCRVRVKSDPDTAVVVTCLECGSRRRFPAVREKAYRRRQSAS